MHEQESQPRLAEPTPDHASRQRGAWFGVAVGDALGAPYEFKHPDAIALVAPSRLVMTDSMLWDAGEWTDDTDLTLAASAAYSDGHFELAGAATAMFAWLNRGPKDVGRLTRKALRTIAGGVATPSQAGELAMHGNPHAAGNGSLMRASSTGLCRAQDDPRLDEGSAVLSRITHADPRCVQACIAYNVVLASLVGGRSTTAALEAASQRVDDSGVQAVLRRCLNGGVAVYGARRTTMIETVDEAIAVMAERFQSSASKGVIARYRWLLFGTEERQFVIQGEDGRYQVKENDSSPADVTLDASVETYLRLVNRQLGGLWPS